MAKKYRVGYVVGDKMTKTAVVMVETMRRHPLYRKTIKYRHKYKAHDEDNACQVGDIVRIEECRPISKTKRWQVVKIISRRSIPKEIELADIEPATLVGETQSESDEDEAHL
jgi:small subunit ribosomal protein S17